MNLAEQFNVRKGIGVRPTRAVAQKGLQPEMQAN